MEDFHIDFNPSLPTMPLDSNISGNTMVETIYFDKNFPHADGWVSNFKRKVQNILRLRGDVFSRPQLVGGQPRTLLPQTLPKSVWSGSQWSAGRRCRLISIGEAHQSISKTRSYWSSTRTGGWVS
jgi:hypothetical protein